MNTPGSAYPVAQRRADVETLHGHRIADPYRWLEDPASPATTAWATAQDDLYAAHLARWEGRERAASRIAELTRAGAIGTPRWRGERQFVMRRNPDQEHAVLLVIEPGEDGAPVERTLVDPFALDPTGLTTLDAWQPSIEGDLLAYQLSEGGTEESVLRVMDVTTGELVDGPIDRGRYSPVAWLPADAGPRAFYYVRRLPPEGLPESERQFHRRVYLHRLGDDPADDVEIFGSGRDIRSYYGVHVSRDGRWLVITAATGTAPRNDVWLADLRATGVARPALRAVVTRRDAQTTAYVGRDGRLYLFTDLDAPRGRFAVVEDPSEEIGPDAWRTLLADDEAVLTDVAVCDGEELDAPLVVASWTRHAVSELTVHDLATGQRLSGERGRVALPGLGTVGGLVERPDGGPVVWFGYTDFTTPQHVHSYDARTGEVALFAAPPGAVRSVPVHAEQVSATSADGTTVRMFVLRPDVTSPTPAPTVLYGYGGFGVPMAPGYSAGMLAWVEAGGVYAIACLRGGTEEGEEWHRAGMLGAKQRVFEDFEACAQWLIDAGLSTPETLCISGGSNGGLLVGAALTRRPDLYRAVICSAPLLDMVRYERFGLGATWNVEYGSAEVAEELEWLLGYSPYHHVAPDAASVAYPAVLFTVFDGDTRVDPLHARKMCAALQHATGADPATHPVLIRAERDVGHSVRSLSRAVALSAETTAFAAHHTGLRLPPAGGQAS